MTPNESPNEPRTPLYVGDAIQRHAHDAQHDYGPSFQHGRRDWGHWPFDVYDPPRSEPGLMTTGNPQFPIEFVPRLPDRTLLHPFDAHPTEYTQDTTPRHA